MLRAGKVLPPRTLFIMAEVQGPNPEPGAQSHGPKPSKSRELPIYTQLHTLVINSEVKHKHVTLYLKYFYF